MITRCTILCPWVQITHPDGTLENIPSITRDYPPPGGYSHSAINAVGTVPPTPNTVLVDCYVQDVASPNPPGNQLAAILADPNYGPAAVLTQELWL